MTRRRPPARIGGKNFSTLGEALSSAKENDTIVLLSDIAEENLDADKSVTLTTDGAAVYLIKIGDGNIFNISEGVTLTVKGSQSAPIIFEGNSVARGGRAFSSAGSLELEYVTFQNLNGTSADGTAINLWGEGNTLSMQNCTFSNVAGNGRGGAVYIASGTVQFTDCTFSANKAWSAGACYTGSGTVTFSGCSIDGNSSNSTAGAVLINWANTINVSFDGCSVTNNSCSGNGIIYINYYYYPGYNDWGLGQKLLTFTNSVFSDNKSGGADIFTAYNWLQLNAEGSEITASVNKKIELKSGYEGLNITLMHDTGIDGEIVRRSDTPMDSAVFDHFKLSDALAIKYRLELGQTGNSLWLRQLGFTVTIEDNGKTTTDGKNYVYGDSFTLPAAPAAPEGFEFSGWKYGDKLYNANEEITLDSGDKISAVYTQYSFRMKLVYSDGEGESTQTYRKGDIISISDLATPAGGNFAGWLYKGAVYLPGDKIVFDGRNYTFVAAYTSAETPGGNDGNSGNEGSTDNDGDNTPSTPTDNGSLIAKIVIAVAVVLVAAAIIMVIIFVHKSRKNKLR